MQRMSETPALPKAQHSTLMWSPWLSHARCSLSPTLVPTAVPAEHGHTHHMFTPLTPTPPRNADTQHCCPRHIRLPLWHRLRGMQHPLPPANPAPTTSRDTRAASPTPSRSCPHPLRPQGVTACPRPCHGYSCCSPVPAPSTPHLPLGPCLDPALAQRISLPASCSPHQPPPPLAFVWN